MFYRTTADPRAHYAVQLLSTLHNFRERMNGRECRICFLYSHCPSFLQFFFLSLFSVCRFSSVNANNDGVARDVIYSILFRLEGHCNYLKYFCLTSTIMLSSHLIHTFISFVIFRNHQQGIHIYLESIIDFFVL